MVLIVAMNLICHQYIEQKNQLVNKKGKLSESDLYLQKDRPRVSTPKNDSRMSKETIPPKDLKEK